ncbi:MAG: hypothetical protein IJS97_06725 [Prevotella sp.]|nr:hypothetical protein [Prevotella sp.]
MKKSFLLTFAFLACSLLLASAQESKFVGIWTRAGVTGTEHPCKMFTADGRLYAFYAFDDGRPAATWFLGNYEILNENTFEEQLFFHSSVQWQKNLKQKFQFDDDDHMTSSFINLQANGQAPLQTEQWVRVKEGVCFLPEPDAETWQQLKQDALVQFGRVPASGQTAAQMADSLYQASQEAKNSRKLDEALNDLIIRAELDTTNIAWQKDVQNFLYDLGALLPIGAKYARRVAFIAGEENAATDPDVYRAYELLTRIYLAVQESAGADSSLKHLIDIDQANGKPTDAGTAYKWLMRGVANSGQQKFAEAYDYAMKAAGILMDTQTDNPAFLSDCYMVAMMAAMNGQKRADAIATAKTLITLCADNEQLKSKKETAAGIISACYAKMIEQNEPNAQKEYEEFMKDKLFVVIFGNSQSEVPDAQNLKGEYYLMKYMNWHFNSTIPLDLDVTRTETMEMVLWKDGVYTTLTIPVDAKHIGAEFFVRTVGKDFKQQMAKSWKTELKQQKK